MKGSPFFVWVSGLVSTQCALNVELGKLQLMVIAKEGW